jgi:acetylornithine deacetylase
MPTVCRLGGALTLVPGEKLETVMAEIEATIADAAVRNPWLEDHTPKIEWLAGVSSAETPDDHPLYRLVAGELSAVGAAPRVNPLHTSSDIRNPIIQKGIPTVGYGPLCGDLTMAGGREEWVDVADLHRAVAATAIIIASACGARVR